MDIKTIKKRTNRDNVEARRYITITLNCKVIGIWGNLKKLSEDLKQGDEDFLSYSSLSKKRREQVPIEFSTSKGRYQIYIEKLK